MRNTIVLDLFEKIDLFYKLAYFQGTEEPKKYKIDKTDYIKPRKLLFKNYDLYDVEGVDGPAKEGPGKGLYSGKYKSVKEFRNRKSNRIELLQSLAIDFAIDDQIKSDPILGESDSYYNSVPFGGQLDKYLPENDLEGKDPTKLNFGRDYENDEIANIEDLLDQYINPKEPDQLLPQGIEDDLEYERPINYTTNSTMYSEAELSLYHGTCISNFESIKNNGLIPQVGEFVSTMYDEQDNANLVFLADKAGMDKCLVAMIRAISVYIGKAFHEVTDDDIWKYGLLVKLKGSIGNTEVDVEHRPNESSEIWEMENQNLNSVEPGDYYSEQNLMPDEFITRDKMFKVFHRYGILPRDYGGATVKELQDSLINLYLHMYKVEDKKQVIDKVRSMTDKKELTNHIRHYKNI